MHAEGPMSLDRELLMVECQQKKLRMVQGRKQLDWFDAQVKDIPLESHPVVRCKYCHGAVRVHRQHVAHGPVDHVEHLSRQDSEGCMGGFHFQGVHRLSSNPVE